ncbi:MAG: hypothetical protein IH621_14495, partial [Krumholzibacteria bacterium]|nr:hypothetical protein [Candidatus Krumholzibacteria bacterium]
MHHRVRAAVMPAFMLFLVPAAGLAWEQPAHWPAVGEVATWKSLDVMFYRLRDDPLFLDRSQDRTDQRSAYAKTSQYRGSLDTVGLEAWLALPDGEREERARLAAKQLDFVVDFRRRIEQQVQRTRQSEPSGWGIRVSDITTVGDCLQRLRTAVGLDPANPYAWHLYAWFASCVGDLDRAGRALAGAEQALAQVPEAELMGVRRGVALDQAWLGWERGRIG